MATASATKYVYYFGGKEADGNATMKELLGGKGANLAEMCRIGLPVPAGFTITTEVCTYYYDNGRQYPPELREEVAEAMRKTEVEMGDKFGDPENPLLVACRSGARESMPGMMDTVLNIGLNDTTVEVLAKKSGSPRFAYDSYRRLLQMYGDVVLGLKPEKKTDPDYFEDVLEEIKKERGIELDNELTVDDLKLVCDRFKKIIKEKAGVDFPQDPEEQIWGAIGAVFGSWMNDRAMVYRRDNGIPHEWGTACNVVAMVFGNLGDDCATGVALTRHGSFGSPGVNGDYLINAQGEDVVAGIRPTKSIEETLEKDMPEAAKELFDVCKKLEAHYRDMQDIEFTIQNNRLWLLQTRNAKRTGFAYVRVAHDLVKEGVISKEEALSKRRLPPESLSQLLQPIFEPAAKTKADKEGSRLTKGIAAGPGAAFGKICFHASDAEKEWNAAPDGKKPNLILVRHETSPEDIRGMRVAKGILTKLGGTSSHAALVSRQMGKVCIVGAANLEIDYAKEEIRAGGRTLKVGDDISIDGFSGDVYAGSIPTLPSEVVQVLVDKTMKAEESETYQTFAEILDWAEEYRKLGVRTNADSPKDARVAIAFGAEGIGLCRTEHMFFDHLPEFRQMILAHDDHEQEEARKKAGLKSVFITGDYGSELMTEREKALKAMLPFQTEDFAGLFEAMAGRPVTVRLLDPPLHEFLPDAAKDKNFETTIADISKATGRSPEEIHRKIESLEENNPMLGHRGCRLGIVYPEITAMQARAIFEAACATKKKGIDVHPEVMIPLAGFKTELADQAAIVHEVAKNVFKEQGTEVEYLVGTMIEIPRAALCADQIAEVAQFFSFGTNDLTQTALGMSRDDYGPFITYYREHDIIENDPFQVLDQSGVGQLVKMGVEKGRSTKPQLKVGICGEHGGEPSSVKFCHGAGLDYVSCSPFRVPVARIAAAQAVLEEKA